MRDYLDIIRQVEKAHMQADRSPTTPPTGETGRTMQAGATIIWTRAGQAQQGCVDFIHVDETGTRWACVTIGESWAFVNLKFANGGGT